MAGDGVCNMLALEDFVVEHKGRYVVRGTNSSKDLYLWFVCW